MSIDPPLESIELTDGRLVVRGYTLQDVDAVFEAVRASIDELRPWMPWCHANYSIDDTRAFVTLSREVGQRGEEYNFGVFSLQGELWGSCGLNRRDRLNRTANLGYWVHSARSGQGIATASARLVARFAFDQLRLERLTILAALANHASQAVARKVGGHYEGVARRAIRAADQQHDAACYSLIPADLREAL